MTWRSITVRVGEGFELYDLLRPLVGSKVTDLKVAILGIPWTDETYHQSILTEVSITDQEWVMVTVESEHSDGQAGGQ